MIDNAKAIRDEFEAQTPSFLIDKRSFMIGAMSAEIARLREKYEPEHDALCMCAACLSRPSRANRK